MKRSFLVLPVLLVFLLGILPVQAAPAAQLPASQLSALAQYFPAGSPVFATIRSDAAFLDKLDDLVANALGKLPEGSVPPVSARTLLDQATQGVFAGSYDDILAPWLGDYVGFAIVDSASLMGSSSRFSIAFSVTDRAAATAFIEGLFARFGTRDTVTVTEDADGYTLYLPNEASRGGGAIAIRDDILLLASDHDAILAGRESALSADATFQATIGLLPAEGYDALLYLNTGGALGPMAGMMAPPGLPADVASGLLGSQAFGLVALDARTLLADAVWTLDPAALSALGLDLSQATPVDLAFAANLPANAGLVLHAANLRGLYDAALSAARANTEQPEQMDQSLAFVRQTIQGMTGLDLEADILSWMTGDYALFGSIDGQAIVDALLEGLRNDPLVNDQDMQEAYVRGEVDMSEVQQNRFLLDRVPFSFGLVIEAADSARAQNFAAALGETLPALLAQNPDVTIAQGTVGGAAATLITVPVALGPGGTLPLEIAIAANDRVFVIATRAEAEAILSGAANLTGTPDFSAAEGYILDNATSVWYVSGQTGGTGGAAMVGGLALLGPTVGNVFCGIVPVMQPTPTGAASTASATEPPPTPTEDPCLDLRRQALQNYIENNRQMQETIPTIYETAQSFLSSATLSTAYNAEGQVFVRFTLSLAP